jgi:integrase
VSSVLRRAVRLGKLTDNPVRWVDKPRIDRRRRIRFLDPQEEARLRATLSARDAERREARGTANAWRQGRDRELLPSLPHFGDHLTPAVLLSMNTGLRRGELLALRWESIDFKRRILTVEGGTAKSRQTRHVPLNNEAMGLLTRWREQTSGGQRIFEVKTGFKTAWTKLLRRAHITKFRLHDFRHHLRRAWSKPAFRSIPYGIFWVTAQWQCNCDMPTWRPTNGAKPSPNSIRHHFLRLPCAYSRNHYSTAPIVLPD